MKAAVRDRFGPPEVVELRDVDKPEPKDNEVLVRVRASSVNPAEWYSMSGRPWVGRVEMGLRKPKSNRLGYDFAGSVEAVGSQITEFRPGDEVFGGKGGAFAEYLCVSKAVALKPANLTFEQAASVPTAGLTAIQGLLDKGGIQPGAKVLINGASGGVGTFAVQIAKALGAEVTAVCSTRHIEIVSSLGADHIIDYTWEDFTQTDRRCDLLLDVAGSRSWREYKRVLLPEATLVIVGGPKASRLMGPLSHIIKVRLASLPSRQRSTFFVAKPNQDDLELLAELIEAGKVTPVIDRTYELSQVGDALRYVGEGHAKGKVVLTI